MASGSLSEPHHHVQFYESASYLAERVARFLSEPLRKDGGAIVVARRGHLDAIQNALVAAGIEAAWLRARGRLEMIDAEMMLDRIGGSTPDRALFRKHVIGVADVLAGIVGDRPIVVYGEMVDLLWASGHPQAVVTLEELWNEVLQERPMKLLCGYSILAFDRDPVAFDVVCRQHDAVEPSEHFANDVAERLTSRALAQLEQRARALEVEVERRTHLEQRMLELLDVTAQLGAAADREHIAQLAIDKGRQAVGAIEGAIWLLAPGGTHLRLLAESGSSAGDKHRVVALAGDTPIAHVVRTGEPLFFGSQREYADQFPISYARLLKGKLTDHQAFAILPLIAEREPIAALLFAYPRERTFEGPDRAFKTILARQAALALARVAMREEELAARRAAEEAAAAEKAARSDIELLYTLTATASRTSDLGELFALALDTVMTGARCNRAAILRFDEIGPSGGGGVMRFEASRGLSEAFRSGDWAHVPWRADKPATEPLVVTDTDADPAWRHYRELFRGERIRAAAFVPLVQQGRVIGTFMLCRDEPRGFEPREVMLASTVALHVAQGIERSQHERELARAYREEREARLLADEATRAREEILSVVSHDLRNPLGTLLMGATSLLSTDFGELGDRGQRVRTIAERIRRQAERMTRLIGDLVDFAGIEAGHFAIDRRPHKPEEILTATSDIFTPLAHERGLQLETRVLPDLPIVDCDSDRAVQVLSNLIANALKVTPKGGAIAIGAEPRDRSVVFYVRDTGPGIDAAELPCLFERYWRSKQSQYKGAGLGLSIARGIVDAHGGRIWAESQVGTGSTFYFSLAAHN